MLLADTIVAPATPPGEGSVGIIRLSGPQSEEYLLKVFQRNTPTPTTMESHRLYFGKLVNHQGHFIDEVLAVVMRAPHSYSGEDIVEVHCHGGPHVVRSILDVFTEIGARTAKPGEFTQRAFLNGRLDLVQAEAVIELIQARSEQANRIAVEHLDGRLSKEIYRFSDKLKDILALLEAHIDFPDDEVGALDLDALLSPLEEVCHEIRVLIKTFDFGRVLRDGVSILILGRPNVGKSSLMNALLGESRAIVTDVAGTTRDTLEEQLVLAGYPVRLIDAAGVRTTEDPVEQEGVRRAREKAAAADLVLLVIDGSAPLEREDWLALELCRPDKTLIVRNKSDQAVGCDLTVLEGYNSPVAVSAKYSLGLAELGQAIVRHMTSDAHFSEQETVVITERRQRDVLMRAVTALDGLRHSSDHNAPLECLAMDLREAVSALGEITGETTPDEILDHIFSRFCIGK